MNTAQSLLIGLLALAVGISGRIDPGTDDGPWLFGMLIAAKAAMVVGGLATALIALGSVTL